MHKDNQYETQYYSFLVTIYERPGCYIGFPSIERLFIFMAGYETAVFKLTGYKIMLQQNLYDFLCTNLLKCEAKCSLYQLIRDKKSDEEGFDYFFHVLNLYHTQGGRPSNR